MGTGSSEDDYHNNQGNSRKGRRDIKSKEGKLENGENFRDRKNHRDNEENYKVRGREHERSRKTSYEKNRERDRDSKKRKVDQQTPDKSLEERLKQMTDLKQARGKEPLQRMYF